MDGAITRSWPPRGAAFFSLAAGGLRRVGPHWLIGRVQFIFKQPAGRGAALARRSPVPQEPLGSHNRPLAWPSGTIFYSEKVSAGGVSRCARRLSPNTGRARSIRRRPSESVRCDRPSANLEVS